MQDLSFDATACRCPHLPLCRLKVRHLPLKRAFDLFFSAFALFAIAPLLLFIACAIRLTSKGPILYCHTRIGRGGRPFQCYKFRTMHVDAEERLKQILAVDPEKRTEWERCHKLKADPRTTKVGLFLRRSSLDELPQFWNVLKGDLSVVGPRPVVYEEIVRHFGCKAAKILSIRPGITGLWQVFGRSDTDYVTRLKLDEQYVDGRTFWLDLKLILLTIPSMISAKGAY